MLPDLVTGGHAARSMLATVRQEPEKNPGSAASVRGIYGRSQIRSTAFLQFYFTCRKSQASGRLVSLSQRLPYSGLHPGYPPVV